MNQMFKQGFDDRLNTMNPKSQSLGFNPRHLYDLLAKAAGRASSGFNVTKGIAGNVRNLGKRQQILMERAQDGEA